MSAQSDPSQDNSGNVDESSIQLSISSEDTGNASASAYTVNPESDILIQDGNSFWGTVGVFLQMILVLAIVIAIIYFFFWIVKKKTNPTGDDDPFLRRVSAVSMGQGKSVQIITLVDKAYIIGVSDNNVNVIDKVEDKELVNALNLYADKNSTSKKPGSFEDILNMFTGKNTKGSQKAGGKSSSVYDGSTEQVLDMLKKQSDRLNDGE